MKNRVLKVLLGLFFSLPFLIYGQDKYDIHYLSVGSGFYEPLGKEAPHKLSDVSSANLSAEMMSKLFDSVGAKKGTSLISTKKKAIRKFDILKAIKQTIKAAKKEKNPFIFFYFCGHGFTNGELEAHFMATGEFQYNTKNLTYEEWIEASLPPLDIRELLEESKIPYMMLVDTCDDGEKKEMDTFTDFEIESFGLEKADELMKNTYAILIELNRMTGPNPVVFSAKAGTFATILPYTFKDGIIRKVGPICRKAHIVLNDKLENTVSLSDFMVMMLDTETDEQTKEVNSSWVFDVENLNFLRN